MKTVRISLLATFCLFTPFAFSANARSGKIVWWGTDFLNYTSPREQTNGVIVWAGDILSNIVAIAGGNGMGLAVKSDGSVLAFGDNVRGVLELAVGLTNVVSLAVAGSSRWAINRDGTVLRWGEDEDPDNVVAGLTNGYRYYNDAGRSLPGIEERWHCGRAAVGKDSGRSNRRERHTASRKTLES